MITQQLTRIDSLMDSLLLSLLLKHYETTNDVDRYGQIPISNLQISSFLSDSKTAKEAEQFIMEGASKYFELRTYGGRFGNFKAVYVKDSSLHPKLQEALNKNKYVKERLNSW